ncbi:hypothetical protein Tco_1255695 [Tanacetum coccineum]
MRMLTITLIWSSTVVGLINIPKESLKDFRHALSYIPILLHDPQKYCDRIAPELSIPRISSKRPLFKGPHLDKDCLLNEEVKQVEEVKYGEIGRTSPFNGNNGGKFGVGPPGYYTKTDNRLPYGERRQSLEELLTKHQEESVRRSTKMEVWIKKLQENAEINTRNQNASLKNLETQIEQLTKELRSGKEKSKKAKVVIVEHEGPNSPNKIKNLHGISFLSDSQEENTNDQLPTKEFSTPGHFTLPSTIVNFNFSCKAIRS